MSTLLPGHMRSRHRYKLLSSFMVSLHNDSHNECYFDDMDVSSRYLALMNVDQCECLLIFFVKKFCAFWDKACDVASDEFAISIRVLDDIYLQLVQLLRTVEMKFQDLKGFKSFVHTIYELLNLSTIAWDVRPEMLLQLKDLHSNLILDLFDSMCFFAFNSLYKIKDLRNFFAENCTSLISNTYRSLGDYLPEPQLVLVEEKLSLCVKHLLCNNELLNAISCDMNKILTDNEGRDENTNIHLRIFDSILNFNADFRENFDVNNLRAITFILRSFTVASMEIVDTEFIPSFPYSQQRFPMSRGGNHHRILKEANEFHKKRTSWHDHSIRLINVFSYVIKCSLDALIQDNSIDKANSSNAESDVIRFDMPSIVINEDPILSHDETNCSLYSYLQYTDSMEVHLYHTLIRNNILNIFRSR